MHFIKTIFSTFQTPNHLEFRLSGTIINYLSVLFLYNYNKIPGKSSQRLENKIMIIFYFSEFKPWLYKIFVSWNYEFGDSIKRKFVKNSQVDKIYIADVSSSST